MPTLPAARTNGANGNHTVDTQASMRFNGSIWVNLDIALRNLDQLFGKAVSPLKLTIIEWYIMRALFERDGQHASELARAVGRAATSFTPNLDKLQTKGLIERKPDPMDRRAVQIYLTKEGEKYRENVANIADEIDGLLVGVFSQDEYKIFRDILTRLQSIDP